MRSNNIGKVESRKKKEGTREGEKTIKKNESIKGGKSLQTPAEKKLGKKKLRRKHFKQ